MNKTNITIAKVFDNINSTTAPNISIAKVLDNINSTTTSNIEGRHEATSFDLSLLTLSNPVFGNYMFWTAILALKMLLMAILTAVQRVKHKVYANEEDAKMNKTDTTQFHDPNVERVRRAHRNDMENILPYLTIGLLYVCVNPPFILATILYRIATLARILHTIVYVVYPIRQPARGVCFFIQFLITIYMCLHIIVVTAMHI